MSRRCNHIFERFEPWWKNANKSLGLFVENVEKDRCVGSIFGNQFHFLLMSAIGSGLESMLSSVLEGIYWSVLESKVDVDLRAYSVIYLEAYLEVFDCLFVIILHSPRRGAQLSYHKPADHWWSWHSINIFLYPCPSETSCPSIG